MARKVKKTLRAPRSRKFPSGIFFSMLIFMSLILFSALFLSFVHVGTENISNITRYTRSYASTIAEGFTYIAEKNYRSGNFSKLNYIFQNKIDNKSIDEAFFVLNNGKIICHSIKGVKSSLKGNIGNDEFAYNVDLILKPSRVRSRELFFTEYNIIRKKAPFIREGRQLLKNILYDKIDSPGWLVNKAVFVGNKPVGTVNFFINKDRIYGSINTYVKGSMVIFAFSFFLILLLSLIITSRINSKYRDISAYDKVNLIKPVKKVKQKKRLHNDIVGVEMLPNYQENIIVKSKNIYSYEDEDDPFLENLDYYSQRGNREIRDPIKVSKKR